MTWDMAKIRGECLKLMGWDVVAGTPWWTHPVHGTANRPGLHDGLPDPTRSLDDALPLLVKTVGTLSCHGHGSWVAWGMIEDDDVQNIGGCDNAPLAVCLCALRCAGHNLKDFEL